MRENVHDKLLPSRDEIEKLYNEGGLDVRKLAKKYGTTRWSMQRFMEKSGIKIHDPLQHKQYVKDDETLIKLYCDCVPVEKISEALGVGCRGIMRRVKELGITRPKSMYSREQYDDSNDEKIVGLYKEGKSSTEIAKIIGVTHRSVLTHLKHCGITTRTLSESQFNYNKKEFPEDLKDYEKVYDMYIVHRLSKKDLSGIYNVSARVVDRVLREFGISVRGDSEVKNGLYNGDKHPNWKGGRTNLYMRLRTYLSGYQKRKTLKRDKHTCQLCGSKEHLQVHHIRQFRDIFNEILSEHPNLDVKKDINELYEIMVHDERMNDLDNLITYCKECHLFKVHGYKHNEEKNNRNA